MPVIETTTELVERTYASIEERLAMCRFLHVDKVDNDYSTDIP